MGDGWRLLLDPPASAGWNMSVDEALLACARGGAPTLRLYRFARPAATLGYRQALPAWAVRAELRGMEVARRASGGGTVLHVGDLTYSVSAPRGWPELPATARGSYAWVRDCLSRALASLGLDVRAAGPDPRGARAELCFAGRTGAEIELGGYKLVGSAQRRTRQGWLQHGSLRLRDDSEWYAQVLGAVPPPFAPLPAGIEFERVASAIIAAFELRIGRALEPGALRSDELDEALRRHHCRLVTPLSASGFPEKRDPLR